MARKTSKESDIGVQAVFETEPVAEETVALQEPAPETSEEKPILPDKKELKKKAKKALDTVIAKEYANKSITHIDKVIKTISFIVAAFVLLVFAAAALVLFLLDKAFTVIAVGILAVGIIFALIFLFIIYGIGHIITQNNEILKKL